MNPVCVVRCETYQNPALELAVREAVDMAGGMGSVVKPGYKVLLKPNLLAARDPKQCVTTHPAVVAAVAGLVREAGGEPMVGDSPGIEPFSLVAAKSGMRKMAAELGIPCVELNNPTKAPAREGSVFHGLEIAAQAVECDALINLPKLKTHCQMLLTLGIKNTFGTVVAQRKAEWHHMAGIHRETFANLILDIHRAARPALTILDGVWGMEGTGPSGGDPRPFNLLAASTDALGLDMAICDLLGVSRRRFPLYRAAVARGLWPPPEGEPPVLGDDLDSLRIKDLELPGLDSLNIIPDFLSGFTSRYLVSRPVCDAKHCIGCEQCQKVCPAQCIENQERGITIDYDACIRCYCCQEVCPQNAIKFKKGLIVRLLNRLGR